MSVSDRFRDVPTVRPAVDVFDDVYHGPEPPGPGWVEAGTGPRGGKMWKREGEESPKKGLAGRIKDKVGGLIRSKYEKLSARYGKRGAIAVMAGMALLTPVPAPGTSLLPLAIAEGVRGLGKLLRRHEEFDDEALPDLETLAGELRLLWQDAHAAGGQAAPRLSEERAERAILKAVRRQERSRRFAEHFADDSDPWEEYQGPRGGKGWKHRSSGRIIYGSTRPSARKAKSKPAPEGHKAKVEALGKGQHTPTADAIPGEVALLAQHLRIWEVHDLAQKMGLPVGPKDSKTAMLARIEGHLRERAPKPTATPRVAVVPTRDLHVDPARFQYKLGVSGPAGVGEELKGVQSFNPDLAGVLAVWKDPKDGKSYVVNGHHRHELAERTGHPDLLVRYLDAKDAKEARAKGALINIAEGRGTAVDAAKFLRDTGTSLEDLGKAGVSLKGKVAADAANLSRLNDRLFDRVARGTLDETKALAVARHLPDHDLQNTLVRLLDKREAEGKDLSPRVIEEMAREMAHTPKVTKSEQTLFGNIESEESLFIERNEIKSHVRSELTREMADFAAVASKRRAERVGKAGNVLDTEENKRIAQEAAGILGTFDQLANRKGKLSDAINETALRYAQAKGKKEREKIKEEAVSKIRQAILDEAESRLGIEPAAKPAEAKPAEKTSPASTDHAAALAALPVGDLQRVAGFPVRRVSDTEFRIETQTGQRGGPQSTEEKRQGYIQGDAKKIGAYIEEQTKQQGLHGRARQEALDRVKDYPEPSFLDQAGQERAQKGFAALPEGTPVVSLEEGTHGRTGKIVKDASGKNRVQLDGEDGFASGFIEPLDARLSWRVPDKREEGPKQGGLFGERKGR